MTVPFFSLLLVNPFFSRIIQIACHYNYFTTYRNKLEMNKYKA